MFVNVSCNFTPATEPATEETAAAEETVSAEENSTEAVEETVAETEAKKDVDSSITLKLKKTDITISFLRTSVTLELDCDINPEEVTWFTMDSSIAIVHGGVVTSMGRGTTKIYAEYKDQQVACIVRCN